MYPGVLEWSLVLRHRTQKPLPKLHYFHLVITTFLVMFCAINQGLPTTGNEETRIESNVCNAAKTEVSGVTVSGSGVMISLANTLSQ